MSWWVYLEDRTAEPYCSYGKPLEEFVPDFEGDEPCTVPCYPAVEVARHEEGGTYALGGISEAEINITYNYSKQFREVIDGGLQRIHDMPARQAVPILEHAVDMLGTVQSPDYWEATPGNAGYALSILLAWARQHPDAVFRVS